MTENTFAGSGYHSATSAGGPPMDLFSSTPLTYAQIMNLRKSIYREKGERAKFESAVQDAPSGSPNDSLRKGIGFWILGRFKDAIGLLSGTSDPLGEFFLAQSLLSSGSLSEAKKHFDALRAKEPENPEYQAGYFSCLEAEGNWEETGKALEKTGPVFANHSYGTYFQGRLLEASGKKEAAIEKYEEAVAKDGENRRALFRLAFNLDLFGMDDAAIEIYEKLKNMSPADVRAVLNLGILYEDRGEYKKAAQCYRGVLASHPNHRRAKMYLKDAEASVNMYYDEDLEKKEDKLQQILRIPITDFELSVRARNCLAKMEIKTLGDLVRKTEAELLSFKNFGETSLNEIKEILVSKGLRLGFFREDAPAASSPAEGDQVSNESPELLSRPISDLELSVRSRRIVETLGIGTLGDLAARSEKELLAMPNFGQTSMNEIKEKLRNMGISLADSE